MTEADVSLWQVLGISADDALDQAPDDVWVSAVQHAVDPTTTEVDFSLVPVMDDNGPDLDPFTDGGDLAALLHTPDDSHPAADDVAVFDDGFDDSGIGHHDDADDIDLGDSSF